METRSVALLLRKVRSNLVLSVLMIPLGLALFLVGKSIRENRPALRATHQSFLEIPVDSVDPVRATSTDAQLVVNNAFDGLVRWSPSDGIQPQLATAWEISQDQRSIIFSLNRRARFHDGTPVDAAHVARCLSFLISEPSYFRDHYRAIEKITVESPDRVRLSLRNRSSNVFELLAGVAAKVVKRDGQKIVGVGPFVPVLSGHEVILNRDPDYYGIKPETSAIVFTISSQADAIKRAQLGVLHDVAFIPLDGDEIQRRDGKWVVQPMWATWVIGFDRRVKPFDRDDIRHELARRLWSSDFIERVYPGQEPAAGIVPFGLPGYVDPLELGAPPAGEPQAISAASIDILIPDNIRKRERIENWIKTSTLRSPLEVKVRAVAFDEMIRDFAKAKMGAFLLSINAEYPDPGFLFRSLRSSSSSNFLGMREPSLDAKIDSLEDDFSAEKRATLMRDMNLHLIRTASSINLMHVRHHLWMRDCVSGLEGNPISEGYFNFRNVENRCAE